MTNSARVSEEMVFEPGLQECCALWHLAEGGRRGAAGSPGRVNKSGKDRACVGSNRWCEVTGEFESRLQSQEWACCEEHKRWTCPGNFLAFLLTFGIYFNSTSKDGD